MKMGLKKTLRTIIIKKRAKRKGNKGENWSIGWGS
jgi:hypothetical protein